MITDITQCLASLGMYSAFDYPAWYCCSCTRGDDECRTVDPLGPHMRAVQDTQQETGELVRPQQ